MPTAVCSWVAAWWLTGHPADAACWLTGAAVGACVAALLLTGPGAARHHTRLAGQRLKKPRELRVGVPAGGRRRAVIVAGLAQGTLLSTVVAVIALAVLTQQNRAAPLTSLAERGHLTTLVGRVATEPRRASFGGSQWELQVRQVHADGVTFPVDGTVRMTSATPPEYGSQIVVTAKLRPPRTGDAADARATSLQIDERRPPNRIIRWTNDHRAGLIAATGTLPPQTAGLVAGMAVGDTSQLPDDVAAAFKTSGLTHLTAVSGGHFSIVITLGATFAAAVRAPRWVRAVVTSGLAAGFVLLVRPEPSVLRAAAMCAVTVVALLLGRQSATIPSLAASLTLLLVADPWLARSYGFALSCAATVGLALVAGPVTARLQPWLGRPLAFVIAVPLAAQLCCAPILALFTPGLATLALLANVLAAPAVALATVLGLATVFAAGGLTPGAAVLLGRLAAVPAAWISAVAQWCANLPFATLVLPWARTAGPTAALSTATLSAAALWLVLRKPPGDGWPVAWSEPPQRLARAAWRGFTATRRRFAAGVPSRRDRRLLDGGIGLALALLLVVSYVVAKRQLLGPVPGSIPADWQVAACDVGQGDALAVRSGAESALLIDVGPEPLIINRCLQQLAVERIDLLVLTHDHADHVGGLSGAVAGRSVAAVLAPFDPHLSAPRLPITGDALPVGTAGADGWSIDWTLLNPTGTFGDDLNSNSYALALTSTGPGGSVRIVALGDLEEVAQQQLLADLRRDLDPTGAKTARVDLVKMAHHGSASQSLGLARWLAPRYAVVSSGAGNSFGHPTRQALDLYQSVGSQVVRTDECGTVVFATRSGVFAPICAR